ncbi:MAG: hypothetical protein ACTHK8_14895 [Ginsengibacter sp.]
MPKDKKPAKKKSKKVPEKYKEKFHVDGTFEDVMKKLVTSMQKKGINKK